MSTLPPKIRDSLDRRIGQVLLAAAVDVRSEQMRAMSKTYQKNGGSKLGQYLRQRTGNAREGVVIEPIDPLTIGRQGYVRIGYSAAAWYAGWWEVYGKRLGLVATVRRIKGRVDKWLEAARRLGG